MTAPLSQYPWEAISTYVEPKLLGSYVASLQLREVVGRVSFRDCLPSRVWKNSDDPTKAEGWYLMRAAEIRGIAAQADLDLSEAELPDRAVDAAVDAAVAVGAAAAVHDPSWIAYRSITGPNFAILNSAPIQVDRALGAARVQLRSWNTANDASLFRAACYEISLKPGVIAAWLTDAKLERVGDDLRVSLASRDLPSSKWPHDGSAWQEAWQIVAFCVGAEQATDRMVDLALIHAVNDVMGTSSWSAALEWGRQTAIGDELGTPQNLVRHAAGSAIQALVEFEKGSVPREL